MLNVLEFVQQRRGQLGPPRSRRFVRAGLRESRPALSGLRKQRTFWGQPERTLSRATGLRTPDELQLAALLLIMLAASHSSHRYPALPSRSAPPQHALETPQGPAKLTQPAVARPPSFCSSGGRAPVQHRFPAPSSPAIACVWCPDLPARSAGASQPAQIHSSRALTPLERFIPPSSSARPPPSDNAARCSIDSPTSSTTSRCKLPLLLHPSSRRDDGTSSPPPATTSPDPPSERELPPRPHLAGTATFDRACGADRGPQSNPVPPPAPSSSPRTPPPDAPPRRQPQGLDVRPRTAPASQQWASRLSRTDQRRPRSTTGASTRPACVLSPSLFRGSTARRSCSRAAPRPDHHRVRRRPVRLHGVVHRHCDQDAVVPVGLWPLERLGGQRRHHLVLPGCSYRRVECVPSLGRISRPGSTSFR